MAPDTPPSAQAVLNGFEELYVASTYYANLRKALYEIEATTFTMMDISVQDNIIASIQTSLLHFFLEVGGLLEDNYSFDPFININFHSDLCTAHYIPFAITMLFDKKGDEKDLGLLSVLFSLTILEGRIVLRCE
jgi:hypothetical protein